MCSICIGHSFYVSGPLPFLRCCFTTSEFHNSDVLLLSKVVNSVLDFLLGYQPIKEGSSKLRGGGTEEEVQRRPWRPGGSLDHVTLSANQRVGDLGLLLSASSMASFGTALALNKAEAERRSPTVLANLRCAISPWLHV